MIRKKEILSVLLSAILFTILFHRQDIGLNLLIFETVLLLWLYLTKQFRFSGKYPVTCCAGLFITSIATVVAHSVFSYAANFLALTVFVGLMIYPEVKSLLNSFIISISNLFYSQIRFLRELYEVKFKGHKPGNYIWASRIFFVPLVIIILFVLIYRASNPVFENYVSRAGIFLSENLSYLFKDFDAFILVTFLLGLLVSNFILLRTRGKRIIKADSDADEKLQRTRNKNQKDLSLIGLRREYKAAIFLLVILNSILLLLNLIDINWVWLNFEWNGQYLKQFVHEGTYLLILSIFISTGLVLYFFRGNLNFFKQNKLLKYLSYAWIIQNGILTVSVAIRNFRYINYFSLAYKRIWVIIFLCLVFYGLYTVLVKVKYRKSAFYLFKSNAYSLFVVLLICSVFNWDNIIAKYNFSHSSQSFLHLDYLATLSDQSLPYLDKSLSELLETDKIQKDKFLFEEKYMSPEKYHERIEQRKKIFKEKWEKKNLLSWNLPEYLAYRKLFNSEHDFNNAE